MLAPAKRKRVDSPTNTPPLDASPFIAVEYDGQKIVIPRDLDYDKTIASIQRAFPGLAPKYYSEDDILLFVKLEQANESAQVIKAFWPDMAPRLVSLKVVLAYAPILLHPNNQIRVRIVMETGKELSLTLPSNCPVGSIGEVVQLRTAGDPLFLAFSLYLNGEKLLRERRLNDYGVEDEDQIDVWRSI
ncbi:unnamed protein product [Rhizoctonia solani]|uniref:Ubiquitin-like domain-containing protein n=1 Tax=Rhizoctonia solani TaxID=456999 RepID=A0A8H3CVK9_9AGAM|nr:unnamed protein product [Rhizoctonia solani]